MRDQLGACLPIKMEARQLTSPSALNYTPGPYWYDQTGSSTSMVSTATGTGGAAYGICVNNSYTAVAPLLPSQRPSASQTPRESRTEVEYDCTVVSNELEQKCTVVSDWPQL